MYLMHLIFFWKRKRGNLGGGGNQLGSEICLVKQVLAGPDMSDFRLLVQFGTFQVQKWYFDEMT